MTDITISRDGTSVTLPLNVEGDNIMIAYSASKPQQNINNVVDPDPRARDNFKNVRSLTLSGNFTGSSAYIDARTLAQSLIKPFSEGNNLTVDLSNFAGFGSYNVAPNLEQSLELEYLPGSKNIVGCNLNLTIIDTLRQAEDVTQEVVDPTPVVSDGAEVTITNPDNSESVTLTKDLRVTRSVGRPNSGINGFSTEIRYTDKVVNASDKFEISGELKSDTAEADAITAVEDVFGSALGQSALTVDFDGSYGLGEFSMVPVGGQAGRVTVSAGEEGVRRVGPVTLQVVTN